MCVSVCVCVHVHRQILTLAILEILWLVMVLGTGGAGRFPVLFYMPWTSVFPSAQWEELDGEVPRVLHLAP